MSQWTAKDLPSFEGRTVIVTGANSGLGLVTARELAGRGAHVIMAVRNTEKGETARADIIGKTEVRPLDLANLASVRAFADTVDKVDVLINNAGIMMVPYGKTVDGFESQIGTNHLGHFALTNLLLPKISDRVVTVSSFMHRFGALSLSDLNYAKRPYKRVQSYGSSKLANLLFTADLQRRLNESMSPVRAFASHPGYAATELQSHSGDALLDFGMKIGNATMAQSAAGGALPSLYAASQDLPGNTYIGPGQFFEMRGTPARATRSSAAKDVDKAKGLWALSEEMTGTSFPL